MDSRANNTLEGTQLQRKLYQDVDVLNSVCRMQYWKKQYKYKMTPENHWNLLINYLYGILTLVTWKTLAENAPGHSSVRLIANFLAIHNSTYRTLNKQIL